MKLDAGSEKSAASRGRESGTSSASRKLSYKETRELAELPARIEALEEEQRALNARIAGADFYKESADAIREALLRVDTLQVDLTAAYARWHELDSRT